MAALIKRQCCPLRPAVAFVTSGDQNADAVETDPSQRYLRYPVLLGRGACKRVYKAFHQVEGIEVAWNQVDLGSHMDQESRERLFSEIHVLKSLKHRNIMSFFDWWYDGSSQTINFITEYFTSGNLRQYRKKHKLISEQAIKRWAFQILEGLLYLHAHDPPIVHRDLKCDNILVNGTSGQVKIADLGLASCQRGLSVVGTPEFMAPEIYDEVYDEKVDIYSFGMCMLELATLEYPYSECKSVPAIFRKVSQGIPPAALSKVSSQSLRDFVTLCINPNPVKRPSALDLLKHEFFDSLKLDASNMGSPTHAAKGGCFGLPFGSCGNLQALGSSHASNSHARSLRAGASASCSGKLNEASVTSAVCASSTPGSTEASASSRTAEVTTGLQAAAAALANPSAASSSSSGAMASSTCACSAQPADAGNSSSKDTGFRELSNSSFKQSSQQQQQQQQQHPSGVTDSTNGSGNRFSERTAAVRPNRIDMQLIQGDTDEGAGSSSYVRGTTVCLAALGKSNTANDSGEDSDDEVLVSLEDVLAPHPEDLLDPETYHLHSQLTHAGSGCMVMSHAGCPIAAGAEMPLESRLSGFQGLVARPDASGVSVTGSDVLAGMLSRYASSVAAQHQQLQHMLQMQQQQQPQQQQLQQQHSLQDALALAVAGAQCGESSLPAALLCESPAPAVEHRFTFASPSPISTAEQQSPSVLCAPLLSSDGAVGAADADVALLGNSSSSGCNPDCRASTATSTRRSSSCDAPVSSSFSRGRGQFPPGARSGANSTSGSILSVSASLFSFRSEAAALAGAPASNSGAERRTADSPTFRATADNAAESPRQLLRTLSNSNYMRNAGALAAAGLLQMSPGLYLTTPPLLGKLLSKKARNFQGIGTAAAAAAAAAAAGPQCHHGRGPSHDSLASWEFSQVSVSSAAVEQLQQLDASGTCRTEQSRVGSWNAAGQPGSAGSVWPIKAEHGKGSGALSSWGVEEDAAAAPLAASAVHGDLAAAARPAAVQLSSDAVAATPLLSPAAARLAAADAVFSSSMGSSPAAGASPVCGMPGGFGKILVRRRFARNLHPVVLTTKRSASV